MLGSLVSKPVLGAVPYQCFVSGQVSGNLSRPDDVTACQIGDSRTEWLLAPDWSPIKKGTLPNNGCSFSGTFNGGQSRERGDSFNGYSGLRAAFFISPGSSNCSVVLTGSNNPATMYQVLNTQNSGEVYLLGRVTVISLLNAHKFGIGYPVGVAQIVKMFNATVGGGSYLVTSTVTWGRSRVIEYLQTLYPTDLIA